MAPAWPWLKPLILPRSQPRVQHSVHPSGFGFLLGPLVCCDLTQGCATDLASWLRTQRGPALSVCVCMCASVCVCMCVHVCVCRHACGEGPGSVPNQEAVTPPVARGSVLRSVSRPLAPRLCRVCRLRLAQPWSPPAHSGASVLGAAPAQAPWPACEGFVGSRRTIHVIPDPRGSKAWPSVSAPQWAWV